MTENENPVLNNAVSKTDEIADKPQYERITLTLTSHEMRCLEYLIQYHFEQTGVLLSKNAYIRSALVPTLRTVSDWCVPAEKFGEGE